MLIYVYAGLEIGIKSDSQFFGFYVPKNCDFQFLYKLPKNCKLHFNLVCNFSVLTEKLRITF